MSYTNEELSLKIRYSINKLINSIITERFNDEYFESLINNVLFGDQSNKIPSLDDTENLPEISVEELTEGVVDLGLPSGLKWASCNIGASSPCESGLLFQFGRVDGYEYGDTNHNFLEAESPITTSGKTYAKGEVLDPADDAAYFATNGKMRMPTAAEIDELLVNTSNQWCQCTVLGEDHTSHNIYGRLFTSKTNTDAKIFIPAAGYFNGDGSFYYPGSLGFVWSSSVHSDYVNVGYNLYFDSSNCYRDYNDRFLGFSVRGVCK